MPDLIERCSPCPVHTIVPLRRIARTVSESDDHVAAFTLRAMVLQSGPFDGGKQVPPRQCSLAGAEVRSINIRYAAIRRLRKANVKSKTPLTKP
jgi:hypothetical protein